MKIFVSWIMSVVMVFSVLPQLKVVPDLVKVGVDYVSLDINAGATTTKKVSSALKASKAVHPCVLADEDEFARIKSEYKRGDLDENTAAMLDVVKQSADDILNTSPLPYELDEEDSILPISRETFNRVCVLSFMYRITGDTKYAERAWAELDNVCSYDDWCTGHFLATAEMALAVSLGYDWLFDYLSTAQKQKLCDTCWEYAITPALSKDIIKNWFTWSKNNWNSICYSGIGIACLTFYDKNVTKAAEFLSMCYKNMPIAFEAFTPDGVYAEGAGYCESGMNSLVYFIATSENKLGTDYGLSATDGFEELGYFPMRMTSPVGVFNFGDNKDRRCYTPALFWYADRYDSAVLNAYELGAEDYSAGESSTSVEKNGWGRNNALSLLWYNRENPSDEDLSAEPTDLYLASDVGQEICIMRSDYTDLNGTYFACKGGYNYQNHGDLDVGTFVFDALGERWAEELGPGAYDATDYFVNLPLGGRWKNYCKRAEGQNTLVVNPHAKKDDQYALADCDFKSFTTDGTLSTAVLDMTNAYSMGGVTSAERTFTLDESAVKLTITDKLKCSIPSEVYWFMHTKADIEISADGKSAVLTIGDKQMQASLSGDGVFSVMKAESLSGKYEYDYDYSDIQKLTVHLTGVKTTELTVTLCPLN